MDPKVPEGSGKGLKVPEGSCQGLKVFEGFRGGARYFFVGSILMMASFHTFTSEVCKNILLEGLFQNFELFLAF